MKNSKETSLSEIKTPLGDMLCKKEHSSLFSQLFETSPLPTNSEGQQKGESKKPEKKKSRKSKRAK